MSVRLIIGRARHFLLQFSVFLRYQNGGSGRKRGCSDISDIVDIFSLTFINPTFRFSPIVKYENLDYKKSEIFKHLSFRYSFIVKYENLA